MIKKIWIITLLSLLLALTSCTADVNSPKESATPSETSASATPIITPKPETPTPEPTLTPTATPNPRNDYPKSAMIIIGNEFGNTYFDMKTELEIHGFTVTTVGVGSIDLYSSCPNHQVQQVTADIKITEITQDNINDYSVVFIPAGKHHRALPYFDDVTRVLNLCKENQVYISSVCAGNIVLASVEGLIDGYEIACSAATRPTVLQSGGICKNSSVVVDGLFVTAASGGGNSGTSHTGAPIEELAEKIAEIIESY